MQLSECRVLVEFVVCGKKGHSTAFVVLRLLLGLLECVRELSGPVKWLQFGLFSVLIYGICCFCLSRNVFMSSLVN